MGFDINSVQLPDTVRVELVHPGTGQPVGAAVIVAGFAHPKTLEAKRLGLDRVAREITMTARKRQKMDTEAGQRLEEATTEALIIRTLAFEGLERNGSPLEATPENIRELYTDPKTRWIMDQIGEVLAEREELFK